MIGTMDWRRVVTIVLKQAGCARSISSLSLKKSFGLRTLPVATIPEVDQARLQFVNRGCCRHVCLLPNHFFLAVAVEYLDHLQRACKPDIRSLIMIMIIIIIRHPLRGIYRNYTSQGINTIYSPEGILHEYTLWGIRGTERKSLMTRSVRSARQLGALIREERKRKQMSQQELANLVGTGQKTISSIENGNEGATLETVFRLLAVLKLEIALSPRAFSSGKSISDVF